MDTIFALATAHGKAGVAVIRISGPQSLVAINKLTELDIVLRKPCLRNIYDLNAGFLDQALILSFIAPASFTGEDVVEIHLHGSVSVVQAVLKVLGADLGLRMADPGEFTRRALDNGKLDIAQVEGLADLLDAETEAQRKQAQRVLAGDLGNTVNRWRSDIIRACALLEATIDFADEDVPVDVTSEVRELLAKVLRSLENEIKGVLVAERIRSGFEVAIVGAPNVGKSTLLNYLAGRKAALTSEIAGTTRDVIEVRMDLSGLPVTLLDTAGVRDTDDFVEGLGIELALERANSADVIIVLTDDGAIPPGINNDDNVLIFKPKCDDGKEIRGLSGVTGAGVDRLISEVTERLSSQSSNVGIATRERHRFSMAQAKSYLDAAMLILELGPDHYEICVAEIRSAISSLDGLMGRIDVESVLDEIFSSFCLGK